MSSGPLVIMHHLVIDKVARRGFYRNEAVVLTGSLGYSRHDAIAPRFDGHVITYHICQYRSTPLSPVRYLR